MKSILNKIKAQLSFKRQKKIDKTEYSDLAPIDKVTNGDEYLNALEWALSNERVKNIALAGPYGAGKSSIIETYLKQHPSEKEKSLRISMATFGENAVNEDETPKKVDIGQNEIELGILKQLFYKVDYKKIPQSRYRKLHKIRWKHIWGYLIGLSTIISLMEYIFFPEVFNSSIDKIITAGSSIKLPSVASLLLFGVLVLGILAVAAVMYRSILSHFKVKEIKLPVDATVKSEEDSNETVFDKNMDEIVYFFEETKYRLVFFEDLDRLEDSSIFVHLRELNTLLNNYNVIKEPIVFVYAVKDDIFSATDRTKFFDFIVPVIPIINSTNSGEILLEKLDDSQEIDITHEISQSFVLDVSPYISDMRILQNIYNEFIVYKKTLRTGQGLKLYDEPMMALIIFKNLYPCDFADIQMERGIIKQAFIDKQKCLRLKQTAIQSEIDKSTEVLEGIQSEALKNIKELKSVLLCEITNWRGMAYQIINSGTARASEIIQNNFNLSKWSNSDRCTGYYYDWNGNGGQSFSCDRLSEVCASYFEREKRIKLIEESRIAEEQGIVEQFKIQIHNISGWSLIRLVEQFDVEEVLSSEVRENKLLVFLLRRGYIDEKYANYINYFKGNSITKEDMNFILAVKNMESQPFIYSLTKIPMVAQRLQIYEFRQKAIYNFDLLECILSSDDHSEKLNAFMKQLADEDEQSWKFIDEFVDLTEHQSYFIKLLASIWPNMWGYVAENAVLTYERKIHYLALVISNADIEAIVAMNANNEMSGFIEQNEDILQQLTSVGSNKVIAVIEDIHVKFRRVSIENVPEDVLDYIFDNNCYELNQFMIQHVVEYKNKALVPDLKSKNYTTIIKLGYAHLIEYVRENLSQYIETIVLTEEHVFDEEEQIVDLLERSIDNQMLCVRIIEHVEFCMGDITCCCNDQITEKKTAVKGIWDTLLKNNKILPTWENVNRYWSVFKFTQDLLTYIENHTEDLVSADSQCIGDDFIRGFIAIEIADGAFEILLPCVRMDNFEIALNSVAVSRVSIMIGCKYFEFTVARYEEIKQSFPDLCVEFILQNQADYIAASDNIQMDSKLLENLLFSDRIEAETTQTLLDTYSTKYMTNRIAANLQAMGLTINLEIFNAAWGCLDESGKQNLMLEHLELLDADAMHSCFAELEKWYSDFLDRSKQHVVELANTPENQKLAERLKTVDYITSYSLKEQKEYDSVTEAESVRRVISCRVKVIK
ncbi:TniB family NTP-binding protein [Desulfosporosinus lacus]|uniref:YobI-like P-loop NTPase domain-containing protein n=1 Tax=Desulfosporosinus lacus DSM 15449 TaxID=1121420 RepID=A0A1M6H0X0_9FIRM|nr:TniB family NTP-binding protein [Desulfosporosinus lacus]SHJ15840.1 hypothetical protein SAMN02746098_05259 [Desulfosporosinus lacus DSM 15449]